MLAVYGLLNWLLGLVGLAENRQISISDEYNNNTRPCLLLFIFLAIVLLRLGLVHLAESSSCFNGNEVLKVSEEEHPTDQIASTSQGFEQPRVRRYGACAFCGNFSTTRCSRCKAARYCSVKCQITHWRSVHKFECLQTETLVQERQADHGGSRMVNKTEKENSEVGEIESSRRQPTDACGRSALSDSNSCAVCGGLASTRCSRCEAVKYCSAKCLIEDWRWHKVQCITPEADSTETATPPLGNFSSQVGLLSNSSEEENHHHSPSPLSWEFYPEGTTNTKPLIRSFQEPTKKAQDHVMEGARCLEEEVAKSRNEVILLQSECDKWAMRANVAKQRYQSFKKESEHQLFLLKNEKELISEAEAQAQNVVHSLYERLHNMEITVQESIADKRKLEKYIQMLESTSAQLKKELQEERVHIQELILERDESCKVAQIAMREVEVKGKELQVERECVQQLKEDFHRFVTAAESRAVVAEGKLHDLDRKIRLRNDKACAICLTNEKDLAFGCGHMTCRDCGSKISKCPICREQITSLVRLFPG